MYNRVVGNAVMIVGDLHFSDVFTGKHIAYLENCFWCLSQITKKLEEKKPCALVLEGDIIGWVKRTSKTVRYFQCFVKCLEIGIEFVQFMQFVEIMI